MKDEHRDSSQGLFPLDSPNNYLLRFQLDHLFYSLTRFCHLPTPTPPHPLLLPMNTPALLLHALKGTCALNCLAALHLAGPLPVTQRVIMDLTGFDDRAVSKGLNTLLVLDLATCTGPPDVIAMGEPTVILPETGSEPAGCRSPGVHLRRQPGRLRLSARP